MSTDYVPYAVIRAFQDALKEYVEQTRAGMFTELVERHNEDGSKSWDITLPGEDKKVATVSLSFSKAEPKVDNKKEFVRWAMFNAPDLVMTKEVPASSEVVAKSTALQTLLNDYEAQVTDDGLVTKDGEPIPGVIVTKEAPQTFALRWSGDGKRRVEVAYGNGKLNDRLLDTPMPLVEDGGES